MTNHRQGQYSYTEFITLVEEADSVPCREVPDVFFPEDFPAGNIRKEIGKVAKNLCRECPIIKECLLYAITNNEEYGVWGGLLPKER